MKISFNIKPMKISARMKHGITDKLYSMGASYVIGNNYCGYVDKNSRYIYLFNAVKYRHKSTDTDKGRVRVRDAHWEAFVYKIPLSLVAKARQNSRNFNLSIKCD